MILWMTYGYSFLCIYTAQELFEAREVRVIGTLLPAYERRLDAASASVLLGKSLQVSSEVHTAMQARGFRGEIHVLQEPPLTGKDWLQLGAFASIAGMAVWLGRYSGVRGSRRSVQLYPVARPQWRVPQGVPR